MNHPGREAKVGPYPRDRSQCWLCWVGLNQPEKVRALVTGMPAASRAPVPVPWPWWCRLVRLLRHRDDAGVGDTVKRRLRQLLVGRLYDRWYVRRHGAPCPVCRSRQVRWNSQYPYPTGKGWCLPF